MPDYQYQGVDKSGKRVTGMLAAETEGELRMMLRGQGIRPTRIAKKGMLDTNLSTLIRGGRAGMSLRMLIIFTRQLQVLIGSGIPLLQGIDIIYEQTGSGDLRRILSTMKDKISGGSFFWEALNMFPNAFPRIYVALVRAGEASGSLDQILKRLSRYLEDSERIRRMITGALIYPVVIVVVGLAVVIGMLVFVIPKFETLLSGQGQALPGPTLFVINMSKFFVNNIFFIMGAIITAAFLIYMFFKSPEGRVISDRLLFRLPLFGEMLQKAGMARFSRTMQTLLSSGVNLIDAVEICRKTVDNAVLENAIGKIRGEIEGGKTLGMVVSRITVFPKMAVQMISVGEATGNLDKMLEKVADFYEAEVEVVIAGMAKLIEPLIIVILGILVGGLLIAMYLPVFRMGEAGGM